MRLTLVCIVIVLQSLFLVLHVLIAVRAASWSIGVRKALAQDSKVESNVRADTDESLVATPQFKTSRNHSTDMSAIHVETPLSNR